MNKLFLAYIIVFLFALGVQIAEAHNIPYVVKKTSHKYCREHYLLPNQMKCTLKRRYSQDYKEWYRNRNEDCQTYEAWNQGDCDDSEANEYDYRNNYNNNWVNTCLGNREDMHPCDPVR